MNLAKKITVMLICCLLTVILTACSGKNDANAMKKRSEEALKEMLSTYCGLQEGTYRYKVHELNEFSGPDCGVIWSVTTEKDLAGNGDNEFLVFIHGSETWEYTKGDFFSDRYSAQFVQNLKEDVGQRLQLNGFLQDLSYKVFVKFSEGTYFTNYSNLLPIDVKPDDYETYLRERLPRKASGGIRIEIQVISGEPLSMTKEPLAQLVKQSMSDLPISLINVSRYTDQANATRDLYEESYSYYYSGGTWEFEQLPSPAPKEASESGEQ